MTVPPNGADTYASSAAGSGYATGRPRIHPLIIDRMVQVLDRPLPVPWALDIGCGAGLSTAALAPVARNRLGIDPYPQMLAEHDVVAPGARFLVARAEELPLAGGSIDLVTAAGAVNYTETSRFLLEVHRVLHPDGVLAIYDFGHGRTSSAAPGLPAWHASYRRRYPPAPGYDIDVRGLAYAGAGLVLRSFTQFDVTVPMDNAQYLAYVLTGSGVLREVAAGGSLAEVSAWCEAGLAPLFDGRTIDVAFPAYLALVDLASPGSPVA